ncbi:MAG: M3 family oligoendopeptidase [Lactobacillaceae bacterium]|jgi:pepF/M3 family oligoendopeptidase|nr:M3 family oligoendopeptidase [Lactobacillaceae bacterium]
MSYSQNWDLDVFFKGGIDSPELSAKIDELKSQLGELEVQVGELSDTKSFLVFLENLQNARAGLEQAGSFIESWSAVNYGDSRARVREDEMSKLNLSYAKVDLGLQKKLAELSEQQFNELVSTEAGTTIKLVLTELRSQASRLLDDETENLVNELKIDGQSAWSSHYDTIVSTLNTSYTTKEGVVKDVSAGQALNMYGTLKDNGERKDLMRNYEEMWTKAENLSADTINHLAGSRLTDQHTHGYNNHLEFPLELNRMSRETLDAMWNTISANKDFMVKFLERKAQLLGLDHIEWQDQSAPISVEGYEERELSYDDAANFIVENFRKYSPKMADLAQKAFDDRWIESEDRPGKQPGGFDIGFPENDQDRIFLTYTGSVSDAATIAHELGHAFHSSVVYDLPSYRQDYAMNVAETASTFAENVVNSANVAAATSDAEKIVLLDAKMENAVAMLMNIHARFLFEDAFYTERAKGLLTAERLNELMADAQKKAFAGVLDDNGVHPHFWTSKLHFFIDGVPFYNFPYVFGYLFSNGIFSWAQTQDNFEEAYIALLRDTANLTVEELAAKHLGADLTKPDFWQASIDLIKKDVDQFMELTDSLV